MIVIAVDQSFTGTGVAVFLNGELKKYFQIVTTKENSKMKRQKTIENLICRTLDTLIKMSSKHDVHFVNEGLAYGAVGKNKIDLSKLLGGIQTRVLDVLDESNLHEVAPTAWKKFVTGSGKADKHQVIKVINEKYKTEFILKDNNICDAIGIGLYFNNELNNAEKNNADKLPKS